MSLQQFLANCQGVISGTGLGQCSNLEVGDKKGIAFINKKEKFPAFTKTVFEGLITSGKLHQLLDSQDFEISEAENAKFTSSQGFMRVVRDAKPLTGLMYRKGMCFDKALDTLKSNNQFDVIEYYEKGVLFATTKDNENLKGFNVGMIDKDLYKQLQGSDPAVSKLVYQCVDSRELNFYWQFIPYTALDFDPLEYDGVIQTNINVVSNVGGTLTLQVLDSCSGTNLTSVIPAVAGSFTLVGATIDTVALVGGNIEIDYTGTATAISLNIVEDVDGNFYKSVVGKL